MNSICIRGRELCDVRSTGVGTKRRPSVTVMALLKITG